MHEELKEEFIVNKVGGRFKLSTLIQKRMVALNRGSPALVDIPSKNLMDIVIAEILNDKIFLDSTGTLVVTSEDRETIASVRQSDDGPSLNDLL
jgi:DNA-directed RNA polymerase subunit omega